MPHSHNPTPWNKFAITPAIKGQITKLAACKEPRRIYNAARAVFMKHMPREQAKHAARKYVAV